MTRPPAPRVSSSEAEASISLLFNTLGAHRNAVDDLRYPSSPARLELVGEDRHQMQCQATLIRLLSVAESFAAEMLLRCAERSVNPGGSVIVGKIWDKAAVAAVSGWSDQERYYREWLRVEAKVLWKSMRQLAEARNAIAHGLGRFTRQQRRNLNSVEDALKAAGIPFADGSVVLDDDVVAHAAGLCRKFIEGLDAAVADRPQDPT